MSKIINLFGSRVIVNDGGNYASSRGRVVEVKPGHNYRVIFDVFSTGLWFSEDELLPDNSATPKVVKPD